MKRKIFTMVFCALIILALTGCQLALDSADGAVDEDRLVGIFLSTEYLDLFDFEGYMNDNQPENAGRRLRLCIEKAGG